MPVMDGFQFLAAYEELPAVQKQAAVIVMLTTSLHPQDVERMQRLKVAGYLSKPLTQGKISDLLLTHFQRQLSVK